MAVMIAEMVLMKLVIVDTTVRNPEKNEMKSPVFRMEVLEEPLMWQRELLLIERKTLYDF